MLNVDEIVEEAHNAFGAYAGMDGELVPPDPFSALQVRLARWQNKNFGPQNEERFVLGIVEEIGELEGARTMAEQKDAVGDAMVFATQLCTLQRLDFGTILSYVPDLSGGPRESPVLLQCLGQLSHIALKASQKIRGFEDKGKQRTGYVECILLLLTGLGHPRKMLAAAYRQVANEVMQRNWVQDPAGVGA